MGLLFKVSGLYKIPQRPAFSLFSSINNLLLLCFSLQTKEKPILHIKIESSIAERAVMAQSILSSSGRGLTRCKQPLNPHPPPVLRPFAWRRWGQQLPFLPHCPCPRQGHGGCIVFLDGLLNFSLIKPSPWLGKQLREGGSCLPATRLAKPWGVTGTNPRPRCFTGSRSLPATGEAGN